MSAHEIFAASSAATWLECSWSALNAVPEPPKKASTIAAAEEGKRVHALFEAAGKGEDVSDEDVADTIALGMSFVAQLEPAPQHYEVRIKLTDDCGGTADLYNEHPYIATVLDVKNGKWDVDAYHNKQMLTYAAGFAQHSRAEWWRLVIFQPNGLDEEPFKQWVAHRSEIEAHRLRVLRAIADRSAPKPGPHCRWCKAFQVCPAMSTDAGFVIGAVTRRVEDLTTEELVRLLRMIRALGDVKTVYEDALATHLKMGRSADGVALKPGRTWRAWNDATQAATFLMQQYGTKGVKPLSPAQAEKLGFEGKKFAAVAAHKPPGEVRAVY